MSAWLALAALAAAQVKTGTGEAPKPVERPVFVKVHPESKDWTPHALRVAGDPGAPASARCQVRRYPKGEDTRVVVACFPGGLRWRRKHREVRFLVVEGWLEEAKVVTVSRSVDEPLDSVTLRRKGLAFQEETPGSAEIRLAAFDLKPGGLHAGSVKGSFTWRAELPGRKKAAPAASAPPRFQGAGWSVALPHAWTGLADVSSVVLSGSDGRVEIKLKSGTLEEEKKLYPAVKDFPLHLPAFQVVGSSAVVVVQGARSLYVFSAEKDDPNFQSVIVSLTEN